MPIPSPTKDQVGGRVPTDIHLMARVVIGILGMQVKANDFPRVREISTPGVTKAVMNSIQNLIRIFIQTSDSQMLNFEVRVIPSP